MSENILQNIIQKKIEKVDKLKKNLDLKTLDELINKNNSYIDFKEAYNHARQFVLSGKTFSHLEKIQNV